MDLPTPAPPALSVHIPPTDNPSVLTGSPTTSSPNPHNNARSASMAIVTPRPPIRGATTSTQMDPGPNTLLRQLMSNASAQTNSSSASNLQGRRMNYIYRITHQERVPGYMGTLVDSGANGGMAGCDTRVLSTVPHAHVDITGVGGSIMERLPLVQRASGVDTIDEGRIVLIMSQYTHKPDSKTIHSKSQLEHFGSIVHDSAIIAGGHQMVVTHEGYAIPLHVHNGLNYMDMSPATDTELEHFPHVFLTADSPWNPDIVDEEFFFDASDTLLDIPMVHDRHDAHDTHLELFASQHTHSRNHGATITMHNRLDAAVDGLAIFSPTMKRCLPDLDALLPHFGWVSKEHIRDTLAKTSQHYQADKRVPMRKHFRSRFPAANVRCLNEWYSMDTFIADIPAFDDGIPGHGGCKMMQIYGGLDSELLTGFPLASESDLPDTLCDFIREYGAMEGLKSDNAKSETSFAMKDIFRMYMI